MKRIHIKVSRLLSFPWIWYYWAQFAYCLEIYNATSNSGVNEAINVKDSRGLFSPRMDYDQWTPLGRGDPLKNDPTYDYVPPVLDRVHYWIDPASRKPDPPLPTEMKKTEILVLGVSSKKPSTASAAPQLESRRDTYDPFLKFVDAPKFNYHSIYSRPQKQSSYSLGSFYSPPFYTNKNKFDNSAYSIKEEQRVPYTMLMPPPLQTVPETSYSEEAAILNDTAPISFPQNIKFDTSTTEPTISIAEANLVFQSSSPSNPDEWKDGSIHYATLAEPSSQVTWRTPTPNSSNNKNMFEIYNKTENKPVLSSTLDSSLNNANFASPLSSTSIRNVQMLQISGNKPTVAHVAVGGMPMHKGQVSDDTMDIDSSYVNIGKLNAHVQQLPDSMVSANIPTYTPPYLSTMSNKYVTHKPYKMVSSQRPNFGLHSGHIKYPSASLHRKPSPFSYETSLPIKPPTPMTLQTMQTMLPPMLSTNKIKFPEYPTPLIQNYLQSESKLTPQIQTLPPPSTTTSTTTTKATTTTVPSTTTPSSLTTDPLFSHYKQPMAPLRGPMYLIIQGHSKVKTYGVNKSNIHGIPIQEHNEIFRSDDADTKKEYLVRHLHSNHLKDTDEHESERRLRVSKDLQTLQHVLQTGLGAVDFDTLERSSTAATVSSDIANNARQKRDYKEVKEAIIGAQYKVIENGNHTTETYRKGIVEAGDISDLPRNTNHSSIVNN